MSKEVIVTIAGLDIKKDSIYEVINKPDSTAPDGFRKEGTTKLPSAGVFNAVQAKFVVTNPVTGTGVYDTGLYEESPMYNTKDRAFVRRQVEKLRKEIVEPYERMYGAGILDNQNSEFWDNFLVKLEAGRPFVTSNVSDLLELFIAMSGYELAPKGKDGDPKFRGAQYSIVDKDRVKTIKNESAILSTDAIIEFGALLKTNKNLLKNILRYVKMLDVFADIDDSTLKATFKKWLDRNDENAKRFMDAVKMSETEEGEEILNLYPIVSKLALKGTISFNKNEYYYKGVNLGADLRKITENLVKNKDLKELKVELLEKR